MHIELKQHFSSPDQHGGSRWRFVQYHNSILILPLNTFTEDLSGFINVQGTSFNDSILIVHLQHSPRQLLAPKMASG